MAQITKLSRLVAGVNRQVDLTANTLVVQDITVGGVSGTNLTKAILDNLVTLQNGTLSVSTSLHAHDGIYTRTTALSSTTGGSAGSTLIGDNASYSNFTPAAATVKGALSGIDTKLGTLSSSAITALTGDVTATGPGSVAATVAFVGTSSAANVHSAELAANAATNLNTASTIVKRDSSGNFAAGTITASLTGAASLNVLKAGDTMSGALAMGSNKITGLAAGTTAGDAVRYEQAILASGVNSFTAAQSMGSNKLTNLANGTAAGDAVNFGQLQAVSNGNIWQNPLLDPDLVNDSLTSPPGSPIDNTVYLIGPSPTGAWSGLAGRVVYYSAGTWHDILGRVVAIGDRFGITLEHGAGSEGGNMVGKGSYLVTVTNATPGSYAYTFHAPVQYDTVLVNNSLSQHFSHSYNYNGSAWVEVAGPGVITAGAALAFSGNTLNVLYDNSTIDLTSNQLEVKAGGITNSHISSSAAIAYSKLALTGSIVNADVSSSAAIAYSKLALTGSIVNADISSSAAIVYSKLNLSNSIVAGDLTSSSVTLAKLASDSVDESKIVSTSMLSTGGLQGGSGTKLSIKLDPAGALATTSSGAAAVTDGSTLEISSNALRIKDAGVTAAKLASGVFDQATITGGTGSAAAVQYAPLHRQTMVAGQSFSANTTYVVRLGRNDLSETTDRIYAADYDATTTDKFWAIGVAFSTTAVSAGQNMAVIMLGSYTLQSSDTAFASGDIGRPVWLGASGAFVADASFSPTANQASFKVGMVESTTKIFVDRQMMAVN